MTEWEYTSFTRSDLNALEGPGGAWARDITTHLNLLGADGWELVTAYDQAFYLKRPLIPVATSLSLSITGGSPMATQFTIDTTDGTATLQFADDHGDPVDGPTDSVTGALIVPAISSDDVTVLGAAPVTSGTPGQYIAALTPTGVGTANLSVAPLTNSDGSPVLETVGANAGQPFEVPAPVAVTVLAGEAASLSLTVAG